MSALVFLAGLGVVGGLLAAWVALRPGAGPAQHRSPRIALTPDLRLRVGLAAVGAGLMGATTRWPVAALAGAVAGYFGPDLASPASVRQAPIERTEAVAEWTEQLRDTMAAAAGLQQAIAASAPLAPLPIRAEVVAFARRAMREPMTPLLGELGAALADPTADLVVTALSLAAAGEAQELGEVLSSLADAARDDATMRRYVDASRARTRSAVRIITAIAVAAVGGLLIFGQGYLAPYDSGAGQVMLAIVLGLFGTGIWTLSKMAGSASVPRLLAAEAHR